MGRYIELKNNLYFFFWCYWNRFMSDVWKVNKIIKKKWKLAIIPHLKFISAYIMFDLNYKIQNHHIFLCINMLKLDYSDTDIN